MCVCVCNNFLKTLLLFCIVTLQLQMLIITLACCSGQSRKYVRAGEMLLPNT